MAKNPVSRKSGGGRIEKANTLPRLFNAVMPHTSPFKEMGVSGTPVYAGYVLSPEKQSRLIGQEKYRTFSDILSNTTIIAAGVRYFLNIVAKPSWNVQPANKSSKAKEYADFVESVLDDLHTPWSRIIRRCGTYRFHGFAIQEWTAVKREDGKIGFHDIESRPQWTIWRWEVDERGTITGAWQRDPLTGKELGLPRGKIMYLVDDTLTDNPEGLGLFRHLVGPSDRLKEYEFNEGVGFLRDLRGIPVGRAPVDELQQAVQSGQITKAQMENAIQSLRDFVSLEKKSKDTSLVIPSTPYVSFTDSGNVITNQMKWGVELVSGAAPGLNDVGAAINRVNTEMARVLGVEHLLLGADSAGSYALAKEKAQDLYLLGNSVLRDIRLQVEHDLLWPLWGLNGFPDDMMPELATEDVSPKDVQKISSTLRDMATAGATLEPDDEAINDVRDILGISHVDLDRYAQMQQRIPDVNTKSNGKDQSKDEYYEAKTDALEDGEEEGIAKRKLNGNGIDKAWTDAAREAAAEARRKSEHAEWESAVAAKAGSTPKELKQFSERVKDVASKVKTPMTTGGHFTDRAAIAQVYDKYGYDHPDAGSLKSFKDRVSASATLRHLGVSRLDMPELMDRDVRVRSATERGSDVVHFIRKYIPGNGTVRTRPRAEQRVADMNMTAKPPPHWVAGKGGYDADKGRFDERSNLSHGGGPNARGMSTVGDEAKAEHEIKESEDAVRSTVATARQSGGGHPKKQMKK